MGLGYLPSAVGVIFGIIRNSINLAEVFKKCIRKTMIFKNEKLTYVVH